MSGDVQMELYLHEYKMKALSPVLAKQGSSVEKRMQEMLNDLYAELVPEKTQQEIRGRIDAECAAELAEWEAARKFAVFRRRPPLWGSVCRPAPQGGIHAPPDRPAALRGFVARVCGCTDPPSSSAEPRGSKL